MTPEEQLEFHKEVSESRYKLIKRCDILLQKELEGGVRGMPFNEVDYEAVTKIAGVRVHLFRELLEMASLTSVAVQSGAMQSGDYDKWLELINKGAADTLGITWTVTVN